jgi:hypothetical protein
MRLYKCENAPKVLVYDIETAPIQAYVWGTWQQDVALNQIKSDWHVLSWAAKWLGSPASQVMYMDQRREKNVEDDRRILAGLWKLLDAADIVVTQNGKKFDSKKVNARFAMHGMAPPSPYRHIDTHQLAKRHFAFTSNRLEYLSEKLCTKYKKLKHKAFGGFELWRQCLAGNMKAWREMEKYNKHDVFATEELYTKLAPWGTGINFGVYSEDVAPTCNCGSRNFCKRGYAHTAAGRYQIYQCRDCNSWVRGTENLLSKEKRAVLRRGA